MKNDEKNRKPDQKQKLIGRELQASELAWVTGGETAPPPPPPPKALMEKYDASAKNVIQSLRG